MKTAMSDTSLDAYRSLPIRAYLQPKEQAVMALFSNVPCALTREQIAASLGWKESAVCGRVNSLVTKGALIEITGGKTLSGRSAMLLKLPSKQLELV